MTTDTDKLIQVAEAAGFRVVRFNDADAYACDDEGKDITPKLTSFRAAIIADLCGNVEPVAFMFQHSETGRITFVDAWQKENGWAAANPRYSEVGALHGASTVAALKAEIEALRKDAERYRWLRDGELTADYPYPVMRMGGSRVDDQTIWADELDAAIDDAISAAQHPQQEQSK
jgi:hypothetical protein